MRDFKGRVDVARRKRIIPKSYDMLVTRIAGRSVRRIVDDDYDDDDGGDDALSMVRTGA